MSLVSGVPIAEAVDTAVHSDPLTNPTAFAGLGLETLGVIADPLGALFGAGIGWLIEHVPGIRQNFDLMLGNPEAIDALSAVFRDDVTGALRQAEESVQQALSLNAKAWTGDAADAAADRLGELAAYTAALRGSAQVLGPVVAGVGSLVASCRACVRDVLAGFAAEAVIEWAAAQASAQVTAGGSVAAFIEAQVIRGGQAIKRGQEFVDDSWVKLAGTPEQAKYLQEQLEQLQYITAGYAAINDAGLKVAETVG